MGRRLSAAIGAMFALVTLALGLGAPAWARTGEVVVAEVSAYPEGPLWHDGRLFVAEMGADRVSVFEGVNRSTFFARPDCGPTAIAPYGEGFVILCHREGSVVAVDPQGGVRFVLTQDSEGNAFRDPNDAFADGRGGVYFSDPGRFSRDVPAEGALVHLDPAGVARRVASGLWYPNGVWIDVEARELYVSETFERRVLRYALLDDGRVGTGVTFIDLANAEPSERFRGYREAGPDGLERGADGLYYVAVYGEGRILRFDERGRYRGAVQVSTQYVTNIAFDEAGNGAVTGAFENLEPPYLGQVVLMTRGRLSAR